jgi:hypothetical protein
VQILRTDESFEVSGQPTADSVRPLARSVT